MSTASHAPPATPRSASELYAIAAGAQAPATHTGVTPKAATCALCGRHIDAGERVVPAASLANPATFTKWAYLAAPASSVACLQCAATSGADYQSGAKKAKSFACAAGVFPLQRGTDLARFVLNPPHPPFAAVFSTRQKQAMVFRTPLNWSRDVLVLRFDDEMLLIRTQRVRDAALAWAEINALVGAPYGKEKPLKGPIGVLSLNLEAAEIGKLHSEVLERLEHMGRRDLIEVVHGLSTGEAWALAAVVQLPQGDTLQWRRFGEDR